MRESVEANLIADVIWLPLGALILLIGRRVLRRLREEWREQQEAVLAEQQKQMEVRLADHRAAIAHALAEHREQVAADLAERR